MIAKQVPMKSLKKSDFVALVRYITDDRESKVRTEEIRITNCRSDDVDFAALEVLNTQQQNRRASSDKTYHLIVSFRAGEEPGSEVLKAIEERICAGLGYGEHQRISVVHNDTDNLHMHIAINKIHPTRHTIHDPVRDYRILGELCGKLEQEFSLAQDNHQPKKSYAAGKAADMEANSGIESLLGWIRRECLGEIEKAQTWQELHRVMYSHGLSLQARGNGLVLRATDGTTIKASSLGRQFSKPRLETRFGAFVPSVAQSAATDKSYVRKPLASAPDASRLFAEYSNERERNEDARTRALKQAKSRMERRMDAARNAALARRSALRFARGSISKKVLYATIRRTLREELSEIRQQYRREKTAITARYARKTWVDWLHGKANAGNQEALSVLRSRKKQGKPAGNVLHGERQAEGRAVPEGMTRNGTLLYRAGEVTIRDDGERLRVSGSHDEASLQTALQMALQRFGQQIRVDGTEPFREKVVQAAVSAKLDVRFDDVALEKKRKTLLAEMNARHSRKTKTLVRSQTTGSNRRIR